MQYCISVFTTEAISSLTSLSVGSAGHPPKKDCEHRINIAVATHLSDPIGPAAKGYGS